MTAAKIFMTGRSQAVRLPKEFRFEGHEVRIRRYGRGVLLEPMSFDAKTWSAALERFDDVFMPEGRSHPPAQRRDDLA